MVGCKAIVEAEDWEGPAYQTCRNAASIANAFELSRRRDNLSFKHHVEVAALPSDEADALLDWCEETPNPDLTLAAKAKLEPYRIACVHGGD
jgi:hypothetical protein